MKLTLEELKQNFKSYVKLEKEISNVSYETMLNMARTFAYSLIITGQFDSYDLEYKFNYIDELNEIVEKIYKTNN